MEARVGFDGVMVGVEDEAALRDGLVDLVESGEVPVDQRLVEQGPEALGRLELGRVRRQVDEPDALRDGQVRLGVPAGAVEHEKDGAVASGAGFAGKEGEQALEQGLRHAVGEIPEHLARGRLHEGRDVEPLVAMVAERDRPLPLRRPHPACDRLQADAVLVGGEDLDRPVRMAGALLDNGLFELFLNASRSSGVAEPG